VIHEPDTVGIGARSVVEESDCLSVVVARRNGASEEVVVETIVLVVGGTGDDGLAVEAVVVVKSLNLLDLDCSEVAVVVVVQGSGSLEETVSHVDIVDVDADARDGSHLALEQEAVMEIYVHDNIRVDIVEDDGSVDRPRQQSGEEVAVVVIEIVGTRISNHYEHRLLMVVHQSMEGGLSCHPMTSHHHYHHHHLLHEMVRLHCCWWGYQLLVEAVVRPTYASSCVMGRSMWRY